MHIDFLIDVFSKNRNKIAIVWKGKSYTYKWILDRINYYLEVLIKKHPIRGYVALLEADFSPNSISLLLALIESNAIVVPITSTIKYKRDEYKSIAETECSFIIDNLDSYKFIEHDTRATHNMYNTLRKNNHPGLVLFSSGSTGKVKAAVHDFSLLLKKYKIKRHDLVTLTFLLFDHIGGIDTMFYSLSNGSTLVTVQDRSPHNVCKAIEDYSVEVLPVTPTFLNLILLSEAYKKYNLSSLKYITYGTEIMPEVTLKKCTQIFNSVTFLQKYGTTEIGTLRSKSEKSNSVWVKMGGEGFDIRIIDGILQIKAVSAMIGYLNAPNPFTDDGWFITGDHVEQKGQYIRFLGRESEIINVGGEKVYPSQVENIIQEIDNVADVIVYGEKNNIIGNIVCAKIKIINDEDIINLRQKIKSYCKTRLENYMIPLKIEIVQNEQHSPRFKKKRINLT